MTLEFEKLNNNDKVPAYLLYPQSIFKNVVTTLHPCHGVSKQNIPAYVLIHSNVPCSALEQSSAVSCCPFLHIIHDLDSILQFKYNVLNQYDAKTYSNSNHIFLCRIWAKSTTDQYYSKLRFPPLSAPHCHTSYLCQNLSVFTFCFMLQSAAARQPAAGPQSASTGEG